MLEILADLDPPTAQNAFNAPLWAWLTVFAIMILNALVQLKQLRRKPSVDEDVIKLKAAIKAVGVEAEKAAELMSSVSRHSTDIEVIKEQVATLRSGNERILQRQAEGDEQLGAIREKQAENAGLLLATRQDVHNTSLAIQSILSRLKIQPR